MINNSKKILPGMCFVLLVCTLVTSLSFGEEAGRVLTLKEFIRESVQKDTEFQKILIDQLALKYEKDLVLPAGDLVLAVKTQYDFILDQDREEPEGSISLSKLFPYLGTTLGAVYKTSPSYTASDNTTDFTFSISQPIAENAFGHATRLKDKIVGIEVAVAKHQIVEAYEDYLATIIVGYYNWVEAYENLLVGESSYQENVKLLDNVKARQKSNIALPIDVNKVHLQVLAKKEKLIELKESYQKTNNFILKALRLDVSYHLIPEVPEVFDSIQVNFQEDYEQFKDVGRTFEMLRFLEDKSELTVDEEADDLLPSIDLLLGYNLKGKKLQIKNEDSMIYAGVSLEWPIGDQVDRAEYETSKIDLKRTKLSNQGARFNLFTNVLDLSLQINSEKALLDIAGEKIILAQSILADETENYSFGKVTLNDYIDAVNIVDNNRFNRITHQLQYKKLLIEWLRITDRLVSEKGSDPLPGMQMFLPLP